MPPGSMANVEHVDFQAVDREEDPVGTVDQLPDLFLKDIVLRCQSAAPWHLLERVDRLEEAVEPAIGVAWESLRMKR